MARRAAPGFSFLGVAAFGRLQPPVPCNSDGLSMTVTVLLFASYADAFGSSALELELPPGSTVQQVVDRVRALAGAEHVPPSPMVAVNERYASSERVLGAGDEVALIPPVAGG